MELPTEYMEKFGGKRELIDRLTRFLKEGGRRRSTFLIEIRSEDIPSPFFDEKDRIRVLVVGKIHEFGEDGGVPN